MPLQPRLIGQLLLNPVAGGPLQEAVSQRWADPNRLAAAKAGTQLLHHGIANVLAPPIQAPTEQQGAATTQFQRSQMGLPVDMGEFDTPEMRLMAENMDPSMMAMKGGKIAQALMGATGWHGGPNKWAPEPGFPKGRPSLKYIGTGEGAAAYGHGFYAAEVPGVAKTYKTPEGSYHRLTGQMDPKTEYAYDLMDQGRGTTDTMQMMVKKYGDDLSFEDAMKAIDEAKALGAGGGAFYKLDIPDDDVAKFLDWDAPLSEQSGEVRAKLSTWLDDAVAGEFTEGMRINPHPRKALSKAFSPEGDRMTGERFYGALSEELGSKEAASEALRRAGIPGNKYYDQMSRTKAGIADDVRVKKWDDGTFEVRAYSSGGKKHGEWYSQTEDDMRKLLGDKATDEVLAAKAPVNRTHWVDAPVEFEGTRNYVIWDQDVLNRTKVLDTE